MRLKLCFVLMLVLSAAEGRPDDHVYPKEDFYNRNIKVPIDYDRPGEGVFTLYYQLSSNFDFNKPTLFFFQDSQQNYGEPGKVDDLAKSYQFDECFNLVRYEHRGKRYSYIQVENQDGSVNWERVYRVLSSRQVVEDIERVRKDLFSKHPDTKIFLYGRSGGGYLAQEYMAKYPENVARAFIRCAPNPLIMKNLGYIESKHLIHSLDAVDPELQSRLKKIIDRGTVPKLDLLWLMLRLGYQYQDPGPYQASVINELYENKNDAYQSYINKGGFSFSQLKADKALQKQMGPGMVLRALECDGLYLLGPEPDYMDPIYYCYRDLSSPVLRLIEEKKVPPPVYPSLDRLRKIKTEGFYFAGRKDHMSPYQIGVELGKVIKNYEVFIVDDNHMMLKHADCQPLLYNAFFKFGMGSEQLKEAENSLTCGEGKPQ
jgi:pimeloyl-ACP methyl ester carboxylesterase